MTPNQSMPEQVLTLEELRLYLSERQEAEHFLATADHDNYAVEKAERRWQEGIWHLGAQAHIGSAVKAGQFVAAIVVSEPGYGSSAFAGYADLQCLLPGNDQYWVQAQQSPNTWVEPGYWMPS